MSTDKEAKNLLAAQRLIKKVESGKASKIKPAVWLRYCVAIGQMDEETQERVRQRMSFAFKDAQIRRT